VKRPLAERAFQKGGADDVITIQVSVTKITITIAVGDEIVVIEIPLPPASYYPPGVRR
jgi:hypothetical protein